SARRCSCWTTARSWPRGRRASSRPTSGSLRLISAASALLLAYLAWASRGWPLIHDAPLMHYIAWLIGQGAVPYRDAFDMNLPGVYLLHLAVLRVGGADDLSWRLFDLGWLALTCGVLVVYCRLVGHRGGRAPVGRARARGRDDDQAARRALLAALRRDRGPRSGVEPLPVARGRDRDRRRAPSSGRGGGVARLDRRARPFRRHLHRLRGADLRTDRARGPVAGGGVAPLRTRAGGALPGHLPARPDRAASAGGGAEGPGHGGHPLRHRALRGPGQGVGVPALPARAVLLRAGARGGGAVATHRVAPGAGSLRGAAHRGHDRVGPAGAGPGRQGRGGAGRALDRPEGPPRERDHARPPAARARGRHRAGDGHHRGRHPRPAAPRPPPAHALHLRLPLLPRRGRFADREPAGRVRGRSRARPPRRAGGARGELAGAGLRAPRRVPRARASARSLLHSGRHRRGLPDLCETKRFVASSAPTTTRWCAPTAGAGSG